MMDNRDGVDDDPTVVPAPAPLVPSFSSAPREVSEGARSAGLAPAAAVLSSC